MGVVVTEGRNGNRLQRSDIADNTVAIVEEVLSLLLISRSQAVSVGIGISKQLVSLNLEGGNNLRAGVVSPLGEQHVNTEDILPGERNVGVLVHGSGDGARGSKSNSLLGR